MYNMHYFLFVYTKLLCACVYRTWEELFIPGEVAVLQIFPTCWMSWPGLRYTMLSSWLFFQLKFQTGQECGYWLTTVLLHNSYCFFSRGVANTSFKESKLMYYHKERKFRERRAVKVLCSKYRIMWLWLA